MTFLFTYNLSISTFFNAIPNVVSKKAVMILFPLPNPQISLSKILGKAADVNIKRNVILSII